MTLEHTIIRMSINLIKTQALRKIINDYPEIASIGFYKECRKRGIFLHTRFGNLPVIPDSSDGGKK